MQQALPVPPIKDLTDAELAARSRRETCSRFNT
jgi:hypothetical protein